MNTIDEYMKIIKVITGNFYWRLQRWSIHFTLSNHIAKVLSPWKLQIQQCVCRGCAYHRSIWSHKYEPPSVASVVIHLTNSQVNSPLINFNFVLHAYLSSGESKVRPTPISMGALIEHMLFKNNMMSAQDICCLLKLLKGPRKQDGR